MPSVVLAGATFHLGPWNPHVEVWLLVAVLAGGYAIAARRIGPWCVAPGQPTVTRRQAVCFALALCTLWLAADYPIHDVAERSMYSVHMVQHLLFSMVAAPLLLMGTPGWLARWILRPPSLLFRLVRRLARFFPAILVFNAVLVVTHWPSVVDASLRSGWLHFGLHAVILLSALIVWMPLLSPLPEVPRLSVPARMLFLFSQSIVPTVPASFLTFGSSPLYKGYVGLPKLWGLSALEDQQTAGLIMKLAAGMMLWLLIAVMFFRWAREEERQQQPQVRRALDRELTELGL